MIDMNGDWGVSQKRQRLTHCCEALEYLGGPAELAAGDGQLDRVMKIQAVE